jgi:hypothetical protein
MTRRPVVPEEPDAERGDDPEALRAFPVLLFFDLLLERPEDLLDPPDDLLELPRPPLAPIPLLLPFGM